MKSSSSALNLSELYNIPMMNLQPNYFHSGPAQSQQQQQQQPYQQQQVAFGVPAVRVAPPVPVIRVAPPPPGVNFTNIFCSFLLLEASVTV